MIRFFRIDLPSKSPDCTARGEGRLPAPDSGLNNLRARPDDDKPGVYYLSPPRDNNRPRLGDDSSEPPNVKPRLDDVKSRVDDVKSRFDDVISRLGVGKPRLVKGRLRGDVHRTFESMVKV
jgi:hypothetical protein